MSAVIFDLAPSLAILVLAFNGFLMFREIEHQRERIARLTRRVWVLEGMPPCPECGPVVEAEA